MGGRARRRRAVGEGRRQRRRRRGRRAGLRGRSRRRAHRRHARVDRRPRRPRGVRRRDDAARGRWHAGSPVRREACGDGTQSPRAAAADADGQRHAVLLAGARRDSVDRGRRVRAVAAAERSGDAALLLADGRVLRRARVHAGGPLQPPRLLLRMGGRGRAARAAAAVPALRVRVSGAAKSVGEDGSGPRRDAGAVPAGAPARRGPRDARRRRPARRGVVARARTARAARLRVSRRVPARRAAVDGARARAAAIGHRAPAAPLDSVGIGARRAAVRDPVHPAAAHREHDSIRGVHGGPPRLHSARVRVGHRPLPADGHRGHLQEGARRRGRRDAARRDLQRRAEDRRAHARYGRESQQLLGAPRDARGRAGRAVAAERDSKRPRSALLQGPLRLPQSARELRARAEHRSRSRTPELAARRPDSRHARRGQDRRVSA